MARFSFRLLVVLVAATSVVLLVNHRLVRFNPETDLHRQVIDVLADLPGAGAWSEYSLPTSDNFPLPRVLAIYFPQFHRDPLNDKNWGDNFTDWNSLKASPEKNRLGFSIPRPTELGYYDLTDTHTRKRQGELAKEYGIDGFIYHHYWFYDPSHPGPNLAKPLLNMLEDGHPDVPFFLNWCSYRWTNVWMGKAVLQTNRINKKRATVLQEQYFNATDEMIQDHYQWLSRFFHHHNYIKIENQPVFFTYYYNAQSIPILSRLRELAKQDGFNGLYLIVGRSAAPEELFVPKNLTKQIQQIMKKNTQTFDVIEMDEFNQSMTYPYPLEWVTDAFEVPTWCLEGGKRETAAPHTRQEIAGVITNFDNTPRRDFDTARIYSADTPDRILERFGQNLRATLYYSTCCQAQTNDRFVAVNAWNEWAEGMVLEPSDVYGRGFLELIRDIQAEIRQRGCEVGHAR